MRSSKILCEFAVVKGKVVEAGLDIRSFPKYKTPSLESKFGDHAIAKTETELPPLKELWSFLQAEPTLAPLLSIESSEFPPQVLSNPNNIVIVSRRRFFKDFWTLGQLKQSRNIQRFHTAFSKVKALASRDGNFIWIECLRPQSPLLVDPQFSFLAAGFQFQSMCSFSPPPSSSSIDSSSSSSSSSSPPSIDSSSSSIDSSSLSTGLFENESGLIDSSEPGYFTFVKHQFILPEPDTQGILVTLFLAGEVDCKMPKSTNYVELKTSACHPSLWAMGNDDRLAHWIAASLSLSNMLVRGHRDKSDDTLDILDLYPDVQHLLPSHQAELLWTIFTERLALLVECCMKKQPNQTFDLNEETELISPFIGPPPLQLPPSRYIRRIRQSKSNLNITSSPTILKKPQLS